MKRLEDAEKKSDRVLDLRGWSCPWCILKAKSLLKQMSTGQILEVISTDPEAQINFPLILKKSRDRFIKVEQDKEYFHLFLLRG
jgi:tRNA 2-thiouridine synthesizing protein A